MKQGGASPIFGKKNDPVEEGDDVRLGAIDEPEAQ
jgi:hypothetical protein